MFRELWGFSGLTFFTTRCLFTKFNAMTNFRWPNYMILLFYIYLPLFYSLPFCCCCCCSSSSSSSCYKLILFPCFFNLVTIYLFSVHMQYFTEFATWAERYAFIYIYIIDSIKECNMLRVETWISCITWSVADRYSCSLLKLSLFSFQVTDKGQIKQNYLLENSYQSHSTALISWKNAFAKRMCSWSMHSSNINPTCSSSSARLSLFNLLQFSILGFPFKAFSNLWIPIVFSSGKRCSVLFSTGWFHLLNLGVYCSHPGAFIWWTSLVKKT